MTSQNVEITAENAAHVLFQERLGGWPPSTFGAKLLDLWTSADTTNAEQLARAFPGHAAAIALVKSGQPGIERLRAIADGSSDRFVTGGSAAPSVDLSEWANNLATDGLEPSANVLNIDGDDKPIVRLHMAFDPDMPERARQGFGLALAQVMADGI
ncbi:hypothetical protein ACFWFU_07065 [Streptomyces sp. NPDC060235]|uniref:hypothetical protein n=1 Tax=Streptomyces sp. NPDC060235 TaxID=3347080 RepID=UPI00364FE9E8